MLSLGQRGSITRHCDQERRNVLCTFSFIQNGELRSDNERTGLPPRGSQGARLQGETDGGDRG